MKELSNLQLLNLAKTALEDKADRLATRYGKPDTSKRQVVEKIRECFDQIDWIDSEIDRIHKGNPTPPRLK